MSMFPINATLRRVTGEYESDGEAQYGPSTPVGINFQEGTQRAVTGGAETEFATYRTRAVYTDTEIGFGDELTYLGVVYHVAGINTVPTLDGTVLMWEGVLQ